MNKSYVIVPAALLIVFVGFEQDFERRRATELAARAEREAIKRKQDDDMRQQQQLAARRDAETRAAERDRLDRERAEKKQRDYDTAIANLRSEAEKETAEADRLTAQMDTLSRELAQLRDRRTIADRDVFELARAVELQRIARRNAEIELQRTTAMVAARVGQSRGANPPETNSPASRN